MVSEKALEEFKRANYGLLPEQGGGNLYDQMNQLVKQLEESKMAQQEALDRRDELQRQLEDEESSASDYGSSLPVEAEATPLDARIQTLHAKLDELLIKYTKSHPDVVATKKSIADLEKQKEQEAAKAMENQGSTG